MGLREVTQAPELSSLGLFTFTLAENGSHLWNLPVTERRRSRIDTPPPCPRGWGVGTGPSQATCDFFSSILFDLFEVFAVLLLINPQEERKKKERPESIICTLA
jgi:hypothetical protein